MSSAAQTLTRTAPLAKASARFNGRPPPGPSLRSALGERLDAWTRACQSERWAMRAEAEAAERASEGAERAVWLHLLGRWDIGGPDPLRGLLRLEEAAREAESAGDHPLFIQSLLQATRGAIRAGDLNRAFETAAKAREEAAAASSLRDEADALVCLGYIHGERDEPEPYAALTERALTLARAASDGALTALALCNLGGALLRQRRFEEARAAYDEGQRLATELGQTLVRALIYAGRGGIHCEQGQFREGLDLYAASASLLRELDNPYQIARHHLLVAGYFNAAGQSSMALREADLALAIGEARGFQGVVSLAQKARSAALEAQGDVGAALRALQTHVQIQSRMDAAATEQRLRALEARHEARLARQQVEAERTRSAALEESNEALRAALAREEQLRGELLRFARIDTLMGIANRRHTDALLQEAAARVPPGGPPLCLAIFDVDHFKLVNDQFGHATGDLVLIELGRRILSVTRDIDIVGRWGGEEICVGFVEAPAAAGLLAAERIREAIGGTPIDTPRGPIPVTVSGGVTVVGQSRDAIIVGLLEADRALYRAKAAGRNRVLAAGPDDRGLPDHFDVDPPASPGAHR